MFTFKYKCREQAGLTFLACARNLCTCSRHYYEIRCYIFRFHFHLFVFLLVDTLGVPCCGFSLGALSFVFNALNSEEGSCKGPESRWQTC